MKLSRRSALTILATSATLAAPTVWGQNAASSLTIALGADPTFAPFVAAIELGMFAKRGIKAEIRSFDDGGVALDALLTGSGDLGCTVEPGGISRRSRGAQIFVTGMANHADNFHGIIADGDVTKPEQLIGKTIGMTRGSSAHLFFTVYMKHFWIDQSKVKIRFLAAPESVGAFARRDVDVIFMGEPWLSRSVEARPGSHIMLMMGELGIYELTDYFYYSNRLINDASFGKAVMETLIEAHDWFPNHLDQGAEMGAKFYKTSNDVAMKLLRDFKLDVNFSPKVRSNMLRAAEFMKSINLIQKDPDWDAFLRPDVMRAVAPDRVTV